ncbi:hypothetical protein J4450_03945 [Candidatus Micrarchaeota archaeon]|nr:hypothetical protein [Candidatus Micrarchaeota archaeon]
MQAVPHTTERGGNGARAAPRFMQPTMHAPASRVGEVFRLHNDALQKVTKPQVADAKSSEVFLLCVSTETAKQCAGNMVVPADEGQHRTFKGLVEAEGSTMRFYVVHDGETGNSVKFGTKMWSERVNGMGQSSLMEGFVPHADRYYVGVSASHAVKEMQ